MSAPKKIDENSGPACHSGLNIFSVPPTNVSINKSGFREVLPVNTIISNAPIEFRIYSDGQWLDLSSVYLYFTALLEKRTTDNKWVPTDDKDTEVGCIQSFGQSFISVLKIYLNGVEVFSENIYPFMVYMKQILSYSEEYRTVRLAAQGYMPDNGDMNATINNGFVNRKNIFFKGRTGEFMSKLEFDLANQEQYLLNNTDVVFSIHRADDDFLVHTLKAGDTTNYRFRIDAMKMYVKTVDVQPSVNMAILSVLDRTSAKYALRKTEMRHFYISQGRTDIAYNAFTNTVPRRLIIGMVNNTAFKGDPKLSPFKFEHFNIRSISVEAGGQEYPASRYDLKWTDKCIRAFVDMHDSLGLARKNITNGITFSRFKNGFTFFVIPLNSTLDDTGGFELVRNGTTTIKMVFNKAVEDPGISVVVLGEFDQLLSIDDNRVVATDGSV